MKLFQRVTDSGILYEDDDENGEVNGLDSDTERESVEILMDDGKSIPILRKKRFRNVEIFLESY